MTARFCHNMPEGAVPRNYVPHCGHESTLTHIKPLTYTQNNLPSCMLYVCMCMWIYIAQPLQPKQSRGEMLVVPRSRSPLPKFL